MPKTNWIETTATLSVKQTQGFFSKRYSFLLMFSVKIDTDEIASIMEPYMEEYTFSPAIDFSFEFPDPEEIFGLKPPGENKEKKVEKKVRGSLMVSEDVAVSKSIFRKYNESEKIKIRYMGSNPKIIEVM